MLAKRGAVGTGVFDGHLGRTACEDNVNFNEELGLARQSHKNARKFLQSATQKQQAVAAQSSRVINN